ncbi:MAG: O-antigen ligase family protein [Bacteroidota bacterium]|nr:O-antigen ligase family protein [Bacteroidota bacterium]
MEELYANKYNQNKKNNLFWILGIVLTSIAISFMYVISEGSAFTSVAIILIALIITITFYRIDWGFILFVGMVLAFDQFPPRGYGITIIGQEYFQNLKSLKYFSKIDFAVINPLELHIFLILTVWIILISTGKKVNLMRVPVWLSTILFFAWLFLSFIYGMSTGGSFLPALWELRALFYLGIIFFLTPQIIQSREQIVNLIWVCIGAIAFKAVQGLIRLVRLGFNFGSRTELTNHEDPLFFVSLLILLLGLILFKYNSRQRQVLSWISLPLLFVFVLSQRRAAYAALGFAIITFIILLPKLERLKLIKILIPVVILFSIYTISLWNNESTFAIPAQLVKTIFVEPKSKDDLRYYSNLYRDFENYNLAQTVKRAPAIGIGFGNKYDQPVMLTKIPFPLQEYIPHNEIYWLFVKTGAIGFFLFWLFIDSYILRAAFIFNRLKDLYFKSLCAVIIVAIVGQIVVSFYDLQFTYYRNMVFLGMLMGLLPVIDKLDKLEHEIKTNINV